MRRAAIVPPRWGTLRWSLVMLAVTLAFGAVIVAGGRLAPERDLSFEPIPGLEGYRRLTGETLRFSAGSPAVLGLSEGRPEADLAALHSAEGPGVPVALFSDYACPNCPALADRLRARAARGEIALTVHHLGRLGPASEAAARVGAASALQGAPGAMDRRLYRTRFLPTEAWVRETGEAAGLDGEALVWDAASREAAGIVARAEGLARALGVPGTPSVVVDRTLVIGEPRAGLLDALLDAAR